MTEFRIIDDMVGLLGGRGHVPGMVLASGDDAAVIKGGPWPIVAVDTLVEGTHWDPSLSSVRDVGFKLLACNLSDIAAMGGEPGPFFLALTFRRPLDRGYANELALGLADARIAHLLDPAIVCPVGGDLTSSSQEQVFTLTLLGRPVRAAPCWQRRGAVAGDGLWVSGPLGSAAAGLLVLQTGVAIDSNTAPLVARHQRPLARLDCVPPLREMGCVHAAIDLSDGLAGDLPHLLEASHVGAELDLAAVPVLPGVRQVAAQIGRDPHVLALSGGEDYELLVAAPTSAESELSALGMTQVGVVTESPGLLCRGLDGQVKPLTLTGYVHT